MIIGQDNPYYTFDNFTVERHNQLPHAALRNVADALGKSFNPLYIYGDSGDDRPHLLSAFCNTISSKDDGLTVIFITAETFLTELLNAYQYNESRDFQMRYQTADVLIVNDLQLIATKAGALHELFSIVKARYRDNKQTVLASDCSPDEFSDFGDLLYSTFEWGLTADLNPPGLEGISDIIERIVAGSGVSLPKEVVRFIANEIEPYLHSHSVTKFVEDILAHLAKYCILNHSDLTVDLARQALPSILTSTLLRNEKSSVQVIDVSPVLLQMLNKDFSHIYKMSSSQFEVLICERLSRMGFGVERVGSTYAPDGGVDIVAWPNEPSPFPFLLAVQVKHHRRPSLKTGPGAVKELQAVVESQPFQAGVLVTNTTFTPNAQWFASNSHHIVRLRDMKDLKRWIKGDFSGSSEWREMPSEIRLSPSVVVKIPPLRNE